MQRKWMRLGREGVECHGNRGRGKGTSKRDRGKRLQKVSSLEIIAHKCWIEHTWGRATIVEEIRCTAEQFRQFAGAPQ